MSNEDSAWHIDRKISISALITGISSLVMGVALISTLATRLDHLENQTRAIDVEVKGLRSITIGFARMEERLENLYQTLKNLKEENSRNRSRGKSASLFKLEEHDVKIPFKNSASLFIDKENLNGKK